MRAFSHDLSPVLALVPDDAALDRLAWKEVGPGTKLARLARDGDTGLVLYRIAAGAPAEAFQPHEHPGGEMYLVVRGAIVDETGRYPAGSLVWLEPGSRHAPRGEGDDTLIVVLWPGGVRT